jgi:hypothetical protein
MHKQLDINDSCKVKTLQGVVCTGACLCLGTMLAFLHFTNIGPQSSNLDLFERCQQTPTSECNA